MIFDIQYGAMYDGPGLRTCIFFKGCPLRCRWCQNPESQLPKKQLSYFAEKCLKCGECVNQCPESALSMANGVLYRDENKCTLCGTCVSACPVKATELIGKEVTIAYLLEKVQRDRPFYEKSGGGVTVSGGEPVMQLKFLIKTLEVLKKEKINTALETCGYFSSAVISKLIPVTDLFLYDLKHSDNKLHKKFTTKNNEIIKKNFIEILKKAGPEKIIPRIPLIPNVNTDKDSLEAIAGFLEKAGYSGEVHLMPYNPMAKTKWEKIGRGSEYYHFGELTEDDFVKITETLERYNLTPVINN